MTTSSHPRSAPHAFTRTVQTYLAAHPLLANRLLGVLGPGRVEGMARRAAIRAAQQAYRTVPLYRRLYTAQGMTDQQMAHLTWTEFLRLPTLSKAETETEPLTDLLDARVPFPAGDAVISRSSGTTHAPAIWPVGWREFYVLRATFEATLRDLGAHHGVKTAAVAMTALEGGDQSGNSPYRALFSLKEATGWNFEVFGPGEDPTTALDLFRWLTEQGFTALYLISFPGTIERLLDRIATQATKDPAAGVAWTDFTHKRVMVGGQLVAQPIRERMQREMGLDPAAVQIVYVSSDTGQVVARSTRFTTWLEQYLRAHEEVAAALGLEAEDREKAILEGVPPLAVYTETDPDLGLLLTTWKHRPLVRYRINDLAWTCSVQEVVRVLRRLTPRWRRDFRTFGGRSADLPFSVSLMVVRGRADDVVIVNAANVSPFMLRSALASLRLVDTPPVDTLHHFKHAADPAHPNQYTVYLELRTPTDDAERLALAEQWHDPLLLALLREPAASDLAAAHRTNPITLRLFVRSPGTAEFAQDADQIKVSYVPRTLATRERHELPSPVAVLPRVPTSE